VTAFQRQRQPHCRQVTCKIAGDEHVKLNLNQAEQKMLKSQPVSPHMKNNEKELGEPFFDLILYDIDRTTMDPFHPPYWLDSAECEFPLQLDLATKTNRSLIYVTVEKEISLNDLFQSAQLCAHLPINQQ
jgi:hypothetical protein